MTTTKKQKNSTGKNIKKRKRIYILTILETGGTLVVERAFAELIKNKKTRVPSSEFRIFLLRVRGVGDTPSLLSTPGGRGEGGMVILYSIDNAF